ncbi:hypothetical protein Bbelb_188020 [Branchiostoma belcheri]|nr:hypothetical protein Bbelb_188020 [Branchiostoma belcheri]
MEQTPVTMVTGDVADTVWCLVSCCNQTELEANDQEPIWPCPNDHSESFKINRYCFMVQKVGHLPVSFENDWTGLIQTSCGGHRIYLGGNMPLSKKFMEDSQDCLKNSPTVELCSLDIVSEPSKKLFHLYSCGNHVDECTPEV